MESGPRQAGRFAIPLPDGRVLCNLCKQHCKLREGQYGICGVRKNEGGELKALIYGMVSSSQPDPVEKKPLFHFYPGTTVLSHGATGCNMKCAYCQNAVISQERDLDSGLLSETNPEWMMKNAEQQGCAGVAFTYNEPTIWWEFTDACSRAARDAGLYTVYVSNGYFEEDPLRELAPYLDAINIDVKAFNQRFYRRICKADLQGVLDGCKLAVELAIHTELTYLIIPGHNDTPEEIRAFARWVRDELGELVPVHFTRFHPDYKMLDTPATPLASLDMAFDLAKEEGVKYVYLGNVFDGHRESTFCHHCGHLLIKRVGYNIGPINIQGDRCPECKTTVPMIGADGREPVRNRYWRALSPVS